MTSIHTAADVPEGDESERPSYNPGHPWFYKHGGTPPTLEDIEAHAIRSKYQGYRQHDIAKAARQPEPRRKSELKTLLASSESELKADHERYQHYVRKLEIRRRDPNDPAGADESQFDELYTGLSLKYCHLFNDLAHLRIIRGLLDQQRSLF